MKKSISFVVLLFISQLAFCQLNRNIGRMPQTNSNKKQEKIDPIKASVDYLKKELTLDTFQEAAVKTFIEENQQEKENILAMDITSMDKGDKLKTSFEKMEKQIEKILNPSQVELLKKLMDKQKKTKKKKEKKEENKEMELPVEKLEQ